MNGSVMKSDFEHVKQKSTFYFYVAGLPAQSKTWSADVWIAQLFSLLLKQPIESVGTEA